MARDRSEPERPEGDRTELDRLERELPAAQKMETLGRLATGLAHELDNPLAAIVAYGQLLRTDPRLPEDLRRDAALLGREAERVRRLVGSLLDFARRRPPERRPTPLRLLVERVIELQAYALARAAVKVELEIPETLPPVDVDRAEVQQVLLNLTLNAIQAIEARGGPGHLRLAATGVQPRRARAAGDAGAAGGGRVRLTVSDDGPGIPAADRSRIFRPFFTTREPGEGTGLGLSVAAAIIAGHGGRLWYEPGPAGVGSTFVVELPLRAATVARAATGVHAGTRRPAIRSTGVAGAAVRATRVLVVDDEPAIRAVLARALEREGIACDAVADGEAALELIRAAPPDAIMIDHRLVGSGGTDLYEAAVRLRPGLAGRAVLMSGDVQDPGLRAFAETRGIGLLAKPFDLAEVSRMVRELLARPADPPGPGA